MFELFESERGQARALLATMARSRRDAAAAQQVSFVEAIRQSGLIRIADDLDFSGAAGWAVAVLVIGLLAKGEAPPELKHQTLGLKRCRKCGSIDRLPTQGP